MAEALTRIPDRVRLAGTACVAGGLVWVGVLLAAGALGGDQAVAQNHSVFLTLEAGYVLADLLILAGLVGLGWSGATRGWLGRIGLGIAVLGQLTFIAAELLDVAGRGDDLLPLAAVVSTLGMLLVGVATLVERRWGGWQRFTPLLVGVYPLIAMFPFAVVASPNGFAMALWGVCWALLGLAMTTAVGFAAVPRANRET